MKKLLSVLLAVLMLFSAVAVSASAADLTATDAIDVMNNKTAGSAKQHVVIHFVTGEFKFMNAMPVYDGVSDFKLVDNVTGSYYRIPRNSDELYVGYYMQIPLMQQGETMAFNSWFCSANGRYYPAGIATEITADMINSETGCIEFIAYGTPGQPAEDTMGKIMGILTKVFGAILGLLFFNGRTEAGVQMMEELLGGILG